MRNLHNPDLCVKQMCRAAKWYRRALDRAFRHHFKTSVARYIEDQRIQEAIHLLETTDATASAIAAQCGFGDLPRFRCTLVRAKGMGPAAWRKQQGEERMVKGQGLRVKGEEWRDPQTLPRVKGEGSKVNSLGLVPGPVPICRRDGSREKMGGASATRNARQVRLPRPGRGPCVGTSVTSRGRKQWERRPCRDSSRTCNSARSAGNPNRERTQVTARVAARVAAGIFEREGLAFARQEAFGQEGSFPSFGAEEGFGPIEQDHPRSPR